MLARTRITVAVLLGLVALAPGGAIADGGAGPRVWNVYSGREGGVRMVFELEGRRLVPALISLPVVCGGGGPRHRHRRFEQLRNRHFPIIVDRQGQFHEISERSNFAESEAQRIVGRVTPRTIEGTILEKYVQPGRVGSERCRTGKSRRGPAEAVSFRAYRHR